MDKSKSVIVMQFDFVLKAILFIVVMFLIIRIIRNRKILRNRKNRKK